MKDALKNLYSELLIHIKENKDNFPESNLCVFTPAKGVEYNNDLLFIGRAVNGWGNYIEKDKNEFFINKFNDVCKSYDDENLNWIIEKWGASIGYNTKKSAFWRLIKTISDEFYKDDINSVNKVSWNNLYKISNDKGGNPSSSLMNIQFELCRKILKLEIETFNPKFTIFLTGLGWAGDFIQQDDFTGLETDGLTFVEFIGLNKKDKNVFIVSKHPQGKPEKKHAEEIIKVMKDAAENSQSKTKIL